MLRRLAYFNTVYASRKPYFGQLISINIILKLRQIEYNIYTLYNRYFNGFSFTLTSREDIDL